MHPTHETGMYIAGGEGQDIVQEFLVNGGQIGRRLGKIAAEVGPHFVGNGLPDGTIADVFDVSENVVQHPMGLGPKGRPIGGIERVAFVRWRIRGHRLLPCSRSYGGKILDK